MPRVAVRMVASLVSIAVLSHVLAAQQVNSAGSITAEYRTALVEKLADELAREYILPDVGAAMALRIRSKLRAGAYDSLRHRCAPAKWPAEFGRPF